MYKVAVLQSNFNFFSCHRCKYDVIYNIMYVKAFFLSFWIMMITSFEKDVNFLHTFIMNFWLIIFPLSVLNAWDSKSFVWKLTLELWWMGIIVNWNWRNCWKFLMTFVNFKRHSHFMKEYLNEKIVKWKFWTCLDFSWSHWDLGTWDSQM
jgi:hypothetical protein